MAFGFDAVQTVPCRGRLSGLRLLGNSFTLAQLPAVSPPSPAIGCSCCHSNSCVGRVAYDAQEHLGDIYRGGGAEFALDGLQGHKNAAGERAVEGACGGTSERKRRNGKQSRNNNGGPRCVDERKRGA